jgi:glucokinase
LKFLCCDLGGTKADWGIYEEDRKEFTFRSRLMVNEYEDFYEMLEHFLVEYRQFMGGSDCTLENATFGVAGPTDYNKVNPTNIQGWEINTTTINAILVEHGHHGYSSILNDFEALGYGVLFLMEHGFQSEDYEPIYGRYRVGPNRVGEEVTTRSLICGPGTGLGVACLVDGLTKDGFPYIISSEGGHHSMAPENVEQYRYLSDEGAFSGKQSYEQALSHSGLRTMYNFFRRVDYEDEPNYSITSKMIAELASTARDQAATDSIELFCELLANFCGNTVLTFNCDKAVFLWGGALEKLPLDLIKARFRRIYSDRCSHNDRVARVPVVLLKNPDVPLLGCVYRSIFEVEFLKPASEK